MQVNINRENIYLISGLGANNKVFERLTLENFKLNFIDWIIPENKESLEHYAQRMAKDIDVTKPVILIGMSFGGIMVQEISKLIKVDKIIIISSVKHDKELPFLYKISAKLSLHKLIPSFFFNRTNLLSFVLFGKSTKKIHKIIDKYFTIKNIEYSRWAINAVVNWKNSSYPNNLLHIHGTKDSVFPIKNIVNASEVDGGTHLAIFTHAEFVNKLSIDFLSE